MPSEFSPEILHSVLNYYRSKCSQLEYEFLVYKLEAEKRIAELGQGSDKSTKQQQTDERA